MRHRTVPLVCSSRALWAVVLIALALRVGYVLTLGDTQHWADEGEYHIIAVNLLGGHGYSSYWNYDGSVLGPTAYRVPLLPFVLTGIYAAVGPHLFAARLFQSLLGALLVLLAHRIALGLGFSRGAAMLAAMGTAVYPYYIFCAGAVYPVMLAAVLVAVAVVLLLKGSRRSDVRLEVTAGLVLGLAVLDFGHALPAVPLVALWIWNTKPAARRVKAAAALALVACCFLVLAPWIARNAIVMGRPMLSTAFARNFCLGNQPQVTWNSGSRSGEPPPQLGRELVRMDERQAYGFYMNRGMEAIRAAPGRFLKLSLGKAFYYWRLYPEPASRRLNLQEKIVGASSYGPVLLLAVIWFIVDRSRRRSYWLLACFPLAAMALAAVTVSVDRYRAPYDVYLIILAAAAAVSWFRVRSKRSHRGDAVETSDPAAAAV